MLQHRMKNKGVKCKKMANGQLLMSNKLQIANSKFFSCDVVVFSMFYLKLAIRNLLAIRY